MLKREKKKLCRKNRKLQINKKTENQIRIKVLDNNTKFDRYHFHNQIKIIFVDFLTK